MKLPYEWHWYRQYDSIKNGIRYSKNVESRIGLIALREQLDPSAPVGRYWITREDGGEQEADAPAQDYSNKGPAELIEHASHKNAAVEEQN